RDDFDGSFDEKPENHYQFALDEQHAHAVDRWRVRQKSDGCETHRDVANAGREQKHTNQLWDEARFDDENSERYEPQPPERLIRDQLHPSDPKKTVRKSIELWRRERR